MSVDGNQNGQQTGRGAGGVFQLFKLLGVPRGIFSKDITLDPLQHLGITIRLEGVVAA
jgi:hypothetical protein